MVIVCLQVVRLCASGAIALPYHWLITPTPTLYSMHVLSNTEIQKWLERPLNLSTPTQVYPQQELLDLN